MRIIILRQNAIRVTLRKNVPLLAMVSPGTKLPELFVANKMTRNNTLNLYVAVTELPQLLSTVKV